MAAPGPGLGARSPPRAAGKRPGPRSIAPGRVGSLQRDFAGSQLPNTVTAPPASGPSPVSHSTLASSSGLSAATPSRGLGKCPSRGRSVGADPQPGLAGPRQSRFGVTVPLLCQQASATPRSKPDLTQSEVSPDDLSEGRPPQLGGSSGPLADRGRLVKTVLVWLSIQNTPLVRTTDTSSLSSPMPK